MIPVRQVMPEALAALIRQAPLTPEKVAFAWRAVVGLAIDHATSVSWHDGVLHIRAKDAAWHREVERSKALIRSRLEPLLGPHAVRVIEVRHDGGGWHDHPANRSNA